MIFVFDGADNLVDFFLIEEHAMQLARSMPNAYYCFRHDLNATGEQKARDRGWIK